MPHTSGRGNARREFVSKKITQGVSFASMVQGTPPAPSLVSTTENQQNHPTDTVNLKNANPDSATKAIYVLNELINIFNSMGGLDSMYNALSSATNPLAKLATVLSVVKPLNVN
ncbi:hypothetical protein CEXT_417161 [Caerostris extrusa]|uniref:Uncharacterized protein n=1 Tax=Caerostris extrusa TaxID=172846 RepID=A0AAV4U382_CAEEX|nr:hypothetical protein CEXT_417161 [Caerostris extrusa]